MRHVLASAAALLLAASHAAAQLQQIPFTTAPYINSIDFQHAPKYSGDYIVFVQEWGAGVLGAHGQGFKMISPVVNSEPNFQPPALTWCTGDFHSSADIVEATPGPPKWVVSLSFYLGSTGQCTPNVVPAVAQVYRLDSGPFRYIGQVALSGMNSMRIVGDHAWFHQLNNKWTHVDLNSLQVVARNLTTAPGWTPQSSIGGFTYAIQMTGPTSYLAVQSGSAGAQIVGIAATSGPASGGTAVTVTGTGFQTGAAVTLGGADAPDAAVLDANEITLTTPALTAGALHDVVVANPATPTATLTKGWMTDFLDVPQADGFHAYIEKLVRNGVTNGCGGGSYCRDLPVTRAQMAVFLLKTKLGSDYLPPPCTGTVFQDVPCQGGPFDSWIEDLAARGISGGCQTSPPLYCPADAVTRQQMAVFLLKTEHGSSYTPPACTGIFGDVPCQGSFTDWIEQLYHENVTGGCNASPLLYCPSSSNTRGQMAVFLVRTFSLQ